MSKKLINITDHFKLWVKCEFGSIKLKKLNLLHELEQIDKAMESHSLITFETARLTNIRTKLGLIVKQEEVYWKQRARISWSKEGDEKTRFFHAIANGRRNRNFISWVMKDNVKVTDSKEMWAPLLSSIKTSMVLSLIILSD